METLVASAAQQLYDATDYVIGQEKARRKLAVLLERQAQVARGELRRASGAIIAGQTGVGKSYLVRGMAQLCGLPFAEVNATQYTDKGYVGLDLTQMFLPLIEAASRLYDQQHENSPLHFEPQRKEPSVLKRNPDDLKEIVKLAQHGVVMLDEFDKWMLQAEDQSGRNVGRKLQAELLKMVEGTREYVSDSEEDLGVLFDTSKVMVVCVGAFVGLPRAVLRRLGRDDEFLNQETFWDLIEPSDFVRFGLLPELSGRLSVHVFLRPLRVEDLATIISLPGGIVEEYRTRFEGYGVAWAVPEESIRQLAGIALARGTGARGLEHVMWGAFSDALFEAAVKQDGEVRLGVNQTHATVRS